MKKDLKSPETLFDFFHGKVRIAREDMTLNLDPDTLLYLAKLLTDRARYIPEQHDYGTLAELHGRAAQSRPSEKIRMYRALGDHALYRVGFFSESICRTAMTSSYYADMGSAAYYQVDQTVKTWFADAFGPVFKELANRFLDCVQLLTTVKRSTSTDRTDDILRLYQRWLHSGDPDALMALREYGIIVSSPHPLLD